VTAAAIAALFFGAIFSRAIEPGVRVEKMMLTTDTPALRLIPQRRIRIPLCSSLMETAARMKSAFVSARRLPPLALIVIPWIRRDMENRRNWVCTVVSPMWRSLEMLRVDMP
jgi:hypothetical protein